MLVALRGEDVRGYAISQPATPLHFPMPHDISGVGVIDDFYHNATRDPAMLGENVEQAKAVFEAAEAASAARGNLSMLVVCPARWASKIDLLKQLRYQNTLTWHIKVVATEPRMDD